MKRAFLLAFVFLTASISCARAGETNDWLSQAEAACKQEHFTDAIQAYAKAAAANPGEKAASLSGLKKIGAELFRRNQPADADTAYQQALLLSPEDTDALYMLGMVQVAQRNWAEATAAFGKASKLKPSDQNIWLGLGYVHTAQQKYSEATDAFEQVVKIQPQNLTAWSGIVACAATLGKRERGREALEFVRQIDAKAADDLVRRFPILK